jgi:hypothetical protein
MLDNQEMYSTEEEEEARARMMQLLKTCPIPDKDLLQNIGLFINSKNMARILFMNHIYQLQVGLQGVVMDFGTRWGQNAAIFTALRGIYEPFNRHRKVVAFDTFDGFPAIGKEDSSTPSWAHEGGLACSPDYELFLERILGAQEDDSPLSHIRKFEIIKGDASKTIKQYLKACPQTLISLAYFDFDIFQPTLDVLETIWARCVKGAVIAFDELNDHDSPGETTALLEFCNSKHLKLKIQRLAITSRTSYFIVED